jgi:UDP-N-acetylmuramyl pentapeptide synthase
MPISSEIPTTTKSILEQILDATFQELSEDEQFNAELLSKLSELRKNGDLNKASIVAQIMPETT